MGEGLRLKAHHTKLPLKADFSTPRRNLRQSISDLGGEINVYAGVGDENMGHVMYASLRV
jgi:hypothetical protein